MKAKSGRKALPKSDKKIQLYLYVEQGKVDKLGGKEAVHEMLYQYINKKAK